MGVLSNAGIAVASDATKPQATQYRIEFWQENAGLPQNFVLCVLQTSNGYLWLGTKGGLARFDGLRFVTYDDRGADQLRESEVWALAEGRAGSLWIGTYGGGLSLLRDGKFTTLTTGDGLASDFVTSLLYDGEERLWIGTEGGLNRLENGRLRTFTSSDGLPGDGVRALLAGRRGALWIGTTAGLASFQEGRIVNHALAHPARLDMPIGALLEERSGGLLIGTDRAGLLRFKDGVVTDALKPDPLRGTSVTSLQSDEQGGVWIGALSGLYTLRAGRLENPFTEVTRFGERRIPRPQSRLGVETLFIDRERSLWIGTRNDGLARLRDSLFSSVSGSWTGRPDVGVISVFEDRGGATWLGSSEGVKRIKDGVVSGYALPGGASAVSIAEDGAGRLFIGSMVRNGLFRLRSGRIESVRLGETEVDGIRSLLVDQKDNLWIGTNASGVLCYRSGEVRRYSRKDGLQGEQVRALALDRRGGLWIGTKDAGLHCLRDGRFTVFGPRDGLNSPSVAAIYVDSEDVVWVATRRGLNRIRDRRISSLTARNGLPANYYYQIIEDEHGYLWLTYGRGLLRVAKAELNDVADGRKNLVTCVSFGVEDGMRSTSMVVPVQPSAGKDSQGRLWFATNRGAVIADPSAVAQNGAAPPVWIEEVRVDQHVLDARQSLDVAPGRGDLEIHYTALSYVIPEKVRFKYLLEGFDRDWVNAGARRVAYYTNLPPARYRFRVKACNNDGVWNESGASLTLRLKPHFHKTRTFYAICVLGAALALWAGHRRRVREVKERFTAVLSERARIARDMHDTLAQSVVGISAQLQAVKNLLTDSPIAAAEHLDLAVDMVRHTLVEVRRSVWDMRSSALEGGDLVAALTETVKQLSATTPIRMRVAGTPKPLAKMIESHLLHIGQEALSNAVKHADATEIELELRYDDAHVVLKVRDNGRGFEGARPFSERDGHFGLIGMRERVAKLKGQLAIHSLPGQGTEVEAAVPVV